MIIIKTDTKQVDTYLPHYGKVLFTLSKNMLYSNEIENFHLCVKEFYKLICVNDLYSTSYTSLSIYLNKIKMEHFDFVLVYNVY